MIYMVDFVANVLSVEWEVTFDDNIFYYGLSDKLFKL